MENCVGAKELNIDSHMIQQFYFLVYMRKRWKQRLSLNIFTPKFIAALFTTAQRSMQPKGMAKQNVNAYSQILFGLKGKRILTRAITWINSKCKMLRKTDQSEKGKYCVRS